MGQVGLSSDLNGRVVMAMRPSTRVQNVSYTGTPGLSTVFAPVSQDTTYVETTSGPPAAASGTTHVRLCATTDCFLLFGPAPVASVTNGTLLPANSPEYFSLLPLDKISVIQASAAGSLNIVEMT